MSTPQTPSKSPTSGTDTELPIHHEPPLAPGEAARDSAGRVRIFDTTLRDGEQSPGASLTSDEKLTLAHELAALGVDVIEAGFPAASDDDAAAVARIAAAVGKGGGPIVCGLARAHRGDIERAFESVRRAEMPRIHTFLATSDLHLERKLCMTRSQVVERVDEMVRYARELCDDVQFSPEDAGRSDLDFLIQVLDVAIQAGATTLNIPDTVGYVLPEEYGELFRNLIRRTPGSDRVVWSAHCHDDLGVATANTLAALASGARQAEVTINGIGERAGNTSLEEVVMACRTRPKGLWSEVDTTRLTRVSAMVSHHTGMVVPPNKAIVGRNAFAHEAGIHQDGVLKDQRTYEIMTPESVGLTESEMVLGKHSGRHAFRVRLGQLGFALGDDAIENAFRRFKELADRKKTVDDADLRQIAEEAIDPAPGGFEMLDLQVQCSRPGFPTATVRLRTPEGGEKVAPAVGNGSLDAIFKAIQGLMGTSSVLTDLTIQNVSEGRDAQAAVSIRVARRQGASRSYGGFGTDTDVLVASANAYLAALNRMIGDRQPEGSDPSRGVSPVARDAARPDVSPPEMFDPSYTWGIP
ncbi:MAG: 2-isopropylmalate synthase [Thermoanaerobaculia bacterium]|nr:2-isopropylmalate synthase [Thermoanaerobaculia bacterium]